MIVKSPGSTIVYVLVTLHPLASVTTTVYSPATKLFKLLLEEKGFVPMVELVQL